MKIWITGVTTNGEYKNLSELIEPVKHLVDGLVWTFHDPDPKDLGWVYLNKNKKEGTIISSPWVERLDYSRNKTLFEGPMKEGDWFFILDDKERISPKFIEFLKAAVEDKPNFDGVAFEGKRLFYRYTEHIQYQGNPHEGLFPCKMLTDVKRKDVPKGFFTNVRGEQRGEFQWIGHYIKYYFFPNSNHVLLGYEGNGEYVKERFELRDKLKDFLLGMGVDFSLDSFKKVAREKPFNQKLKVFINKEKILNDWYRYEILNKRDMIDKHDPKLIKKV